MVKKFPATQTWLEKQAQELQMSPASAAPPDRRVRRHVRRALAQTQDYLQLEVTAPPQRTTPETIPKQPVAPTWWPGWASAYHSAQQPKAEQSVRLPVRLPVRLVHQRRLPGLVAVAIGQMAALIVGDVVTARWAEQMSPSCSDVVSESPSWLWPFFF